MIYLSVVSTTEERRQGSVEILILEFRVGRHRALVVRAATCWRELGVEPDLGSHLPWVTLNAGTLGKLFTVSWPHVPSQQSGHHIASWLHGKGYGECRFPGPFLFVCF